MGVGLIFIKKSLWKKNDSEKKTVGYNKTIKEAFLLYKYKCLVE